MAQYSLLDLGIVGLALIILFKMLDVVKCLILSKRGVDGYAPSQSTLACQIDPQHYQRIRDIYTMAKEHGASIASGKFDCVWKDRDEVRDLLESMRRLSESMDKLTKALEDKKK